MKKWKSLNQIKEERIIEGEKIISYLRLLFAFSVLLISYMNYLLKNTELKILLPAGFISFILIAIAAFSLFLIKHNRLDKKYTYLTTIIDSLALLAFLAICIFLLTNPYVATVMAFGFICIFFIANTIRLDITPILIIGGLFILFLPIQIVAILFIHKNYVIFYFLIAMLLIGTAVILLVYFFLKKIISIMENNMVTEDLLRSSRRLRMTLEIVEASIFNLNNLVINLEEIAERLSKGAQNQVISIEEISKAVEKLQESMEKISTSSEKSENTIIQTAQLSNNGNMILKRVIQEILGIHEVADSMVASLDLIDEIADQTNLLSLNATIEASRAGEEGTGFTVIADEIRKLAERSSETAVEIGKLVKEIEKVIFSGGESSKEAGKIFDRINKDLNIYSEFIHSLHIAVQNQLTSNRDVGSAINRIGKVTKENTMAAEEIKKVLSNLSLEISKLKELVKGKMRETASLSTITKK